MYTSKEKKYIKQLKESKSPYMGISLLISVLLLFVAIIVGFFTQKEPYTFNISLLAIGIGIGAVMTFLIYQFLTRKINHDIKNLQFKEENIHIAYALSKDDVEPGSGMLYLPILGHLFPKLWGQKMKPTKRYYIVTDEHIKHEISHEDYTLLSDKSSCRFIYGQQSDVLVGIEP